MPKIVACPTCNKPVPWQPQSKWRPFCSERCRLIDLGEWMDERRRISEPAQGWASPEHDEQQGHH